ncbi:MAG TPA: T9SS type A sorting domain-containing protein, partial [Crocinitomix sp.]|nr:T9SS type A sorting domain-containing protein [Crocinitomix sp.]
MKTTFHLLIVLIFTITITAQQTYVPDDNFEQALIYLGYDSGTLDNYVPTANINSITALDISSKNIADLTGIEDFTALQNLNCNDNQLTSLDMSLNTNLQVFYCSFNSIITLDLSQNNSLASFGCRNNQLTSLNVKNGNNNVLFSSFFHANNNPNLLCIEVDNPAWSSNWQNVDDIVTFSSNCGVQTYVPDDNFEQALIDLGYDSGVLNGYVPTANINTITYLDINNKNIADLTGIKDFTLLEELRCYSNSLTELNTLRNIALTDLLCHTNLLTSLDVSKNTSLTLLSIPLNQITNLDLSQNTNLEQLYCRDNLLTDLDLSQNTALTHLYCHNNSIVNLDLSQNTALEALWCYNNGLTSLNVKNGNNTAIIDNNFKAGTNPGLTCIEVDNSTWSDANWFNIDTASSFSNNCGVTYVPDDNFEQALIDLGYDSGTLDNYVPTINIETLTSLVIANKNISSLIGIEDFTTLTLLNCSNNSLTALDVSQNIALTDLRCQVNLITNIDISLNTALTRFWCFQNQLTQLDVNVNTALTDFSCHSNQLTQLDVSQNIALTVLSFRDNQISNIDVTQLADLAYFSCFGNQLMDLNVTQNPDLVRLWCQNNQLTNLNVNNNANTSISNSNFKAQNNPNLTCINVDNPTWSTTNWTNIDTTASFSQLCGLTYIPDNNFEQALIDLGYDTGALDNYVPTANINSLTSLVLAYKNITDLTGIENFISLTSLTCSHNDLTSLDLSQNTMLTVLYCGNNNLTSLDLSQNTALTQLFCTYNQLTNLNITNNTLLTDLWHNNNQLASLDITNNVNLEEIWGKLNLLTTLDVSQNTALTVLRLHYNDLVDIDVTNNTALELLWCHNNALTSLNVKNGNNTNITLFNTSNNPNLTCIEVDDASWSTTNWTFIDTIASFSESCNSTSTTNDFNLENAFSIYPNPTKNSFKIASDLSISKITIYNHLGKLMLQFNAQEAYDVSPLTDGIYFIQIKS